MLVRELHRPRHLHHHPRRLPGRHGHPRRHRPKVRPLNEVHREERDASLLPDVADRHDARMDQPRGQRGLGPEPCEPQRIGPERLRKQLERDHRAVEHPLRLPDRSHATPCDLPQEPVAPEGPMGCQPCFQHGFPGLADEQRRKAGGAGRPQPRGGSVPQQRPAARGTSRGHGDEPLRRPRPPRCPTRPGGPPANDPPPSPPPPVWRCPGACRPRPPAHAAGTGCGCGTRTP